MDKRQFLKRSLDTTNAFMAFHGDEGVKVNPNIWDTRLRDYQRKLLVLTPRAEYYDFTIPGQDYKVTLDEEPSAAADLVETTNVAVSEFSTRNVTFEPTERGARYQATYSEVARAFFPVAERMTNKLAYKLAVKKDNVAFNTLVSGVHATHVVIANGKSALTDIASTDTIGYAEILKAKRLIGKAQYVPTELHINHDQEEQLLRLGTIHKANEFGTRSAIENGLIGSLFGLDVFASHSIRSANDRAPAIVLGVTNSGEKAFGYAEKRRPQIETQRFAAGRYWDIVATEDYDFKVFHNKAYALIYTTSTA